MSISLKVVDVTAEINKVTWDDWKNARRGIPKSISDMEDGLYVKIFENIQGEDVYDANTKPKIVIRRAGLSLKPGKFENKFVERCRNYHHHLRRAGEQVYTECLCRVLVIDLSSLKEDIGVESPARIFEQLWNQRIIAKTREHHATEQNGRAEWKFLEPGAKEAVESAVKAEVDSLATVIAEMADILTKRK